VAETPVRGLKARNKTSGAWNKTSGADNKTPGARNKMSGADNKMSGARNKTSGADNKTSGADNKTSGADNKIKKTGVVRANPCLSGCLPKQKMGLKNKRRDAKGASGHGSCLRLRARAERRLLVGLTRPPTHRGRNEGNIERVSPGEWFKPVTDRRSGGRAPF
jgi:hypothetical protein